MLDSTTRRADLGAAPEVEAPPLARLSRAQFWGIFAFAVTIFLFSTGPVWRHPWSIGVLNDAILWSYLPLPFLVAGILAYRRILTLKAFFLDVLELTLLKYSVTFGLSLILWSVQTPPAEPVLLHPARFDGQTVRPPPPAPPPPTVLDPARLGAVAGRITDANGDVPNALVYVSAGLDDITFAPPALPLVVVQDGHGISPKLAAVMVGQKIDARSADGGMHTLVATTSGSPRADLTVFNVPLLPTGAVRELEFAEAYGLIDLHCTVHPSEAHALIGAFSNPFFALTDADGRFAFKGVPSAKIVVSVVRKAGDKTSSEVDVVAQDEATVGIVLLDL